MKPLAAMTTISRISCRTWAVAILAVFAVAGAAVLDDYGLSVNAVLQRQTAAANLEYVLGDDDALSADAGYLAVDHERCYGVAFDLPLLLAERTLGLDDSRTAHLLRHYVTHLFWLGGGFACFLLARRLFRSGPLALLAMLLFLLSPRLYAHSFFNSKDVPFLSMFMIALCLTHRPFEKDTVRAFVVLGMGTAVLTNLRIMGLMLFAAVLGMRALDLLCAAQWSARRRILATAGAFAAACAATLYAISPYLWSDPREFAEALRFLSEHPHSRWQLFQGRLVHPDDLPWRYVPTWMAITTPPFTLLLGSVGVVGAAWRVAARPGRAIRNTPLRLECLAAACLNGAAARRGGAGRARLQRVAAPVFPACAARPAGGVRAAPAGAARRGLGAPRDVYGGGRRGGGHPDRHGAHPSASERLLQFPRRQDDAGASPDAVRDGLLGDGALRRAASPGANLAVEQFAPGGGRARQLCAALRSAKKEAQVQIHRPLSASVPRPLRFRLRRREVSRDRSARNACSGSLDQESVRRHCRQLVRRRQSGAPGTIARGPLPRDVPVVDAGRAGRSRTLRRALRRRPRRLTYVRAPCVPADVDRIVCFFLHAVPVDPDDLPDAQVRYGFEHRDFNPPGQALFDGQRLVAVRLPEYAVDHVRTGQTERKDGGWTTLWEETIHPGS